MRSLLDDASMVFRNSRRDGPKVLQLFVAFRLGSGFALNFSNSVAMLLWITTSVYPREYLARLIHIFQHFTSSSHSKHLGIKMGAAAFLDPFSFVLDGYIKAASSARAVGLGVLCSIRLQSLAEMNQLMCTSHTARKSHQSLVNSYFRKLQLFNFHTFLVHKLTKDVPYNAEEVAMSAIETIKSTNLVLPHFLVMEFVRMLVDGFCLQSRFGIYFPCILCGLDKDSMAHSPFCEISLQIRSTIMHHESAGGLIEFYNMVGSSHQKLLQIIVVAILRHTTDSLRVSPPILRPLIVAKTRRKYLVRQFLVIRKLLVLDIYNGTDISRIHVATCFLSLLPLFGLLHVVCVPLLSCSSSFPLAQTWLGIEDLRGCHLVGTLFSFPCALSLSLVASCG
jgi:hypothetical protein